MGILLNLNSISATQLEEAIRAVLTDSRYKENARAAQALINDQMVEPKQELLYWVKYVIRHKGAKHLLNDVAHGMSTVEFWSLDVYAFLCLVFVIFLLLMCFVLKHLIKLLKWSFVKKMKTE